jgi:hypothetical protein
VLVAGEPRDAQRLRGPLQDAATGRADALNGGLGRADAGRRALGRERVEQLVDGVLHAGALLGRGPLLLARPADAGIAGAHRRFVEIGHAVSSREGLMRGAPRAT